MKIHYKALLIFAVAICILFTVVFFLSTQITLGAYRQIEASQMRQLAIRFSVAMDDRTDRIAATMGDWSPWTELYNYLDTRNPKFFDENVTVSALRNLGLDFLFIVDTDGNLVDGRQFDETGQALVPIEPWIVNRLRQSGYFPLNQPGDRAIGKLLLTNVVCTVAAFPVLTNLGEGPVRGTVVGGASFSQDTIQRMERGSSFTVKLLPLTGERTLENWEEIRAELLSNQHPVVSIINAESIAVYMIFRDLNGAPSFIAKLTSPRTLFHAGQQMISIFLIAFAICGGVLFLVAFFGLDFTVLSPIRKLQQRVEAAGAFANPPFDLEMPGRDEVSLLAGKIEELATSLAQAQQTYRAVVESQQDLICRYRPDGWITFANPAFEMFFGKLPDDPDQSHSVYQLLGDDHSIAKAGARGFTVSSPQQDMELQLVGHNATPRWFQRSSLGIFDDHGVLVEVQDIFRDFTESRMAKLRLLESESRYRTLFENDWDGILIVDGDDGKIIDVNPSLCLLVGLDRKEIIGKMFSELPSLSALMRVQLTLSPGLRREVRHATAHLLHTSGAEVFVDIVVSSYESDSRRMIQWNLRDVTERRQIDDRLRMLSARLLTLQDQERRRLARELHDSTGQNLTALEMSLCRLEGCLFSPSAEVTQLISESRALLDQCCSEIRTLSYLLHPPLLDEMGLNFAIRWFVDGFSRRTGLSVEVDLDDSMDRMTIDIETALYRIVQESFNNIHRHSGGSRCWVRLHKSAAGVLLEIEDDGAGIDKDRLAAVDDVLPSLGVGLLGMKERMSQLNGSLEILSFSTGTTIRAMVPSVEAS